VTLTLGVLISGRGSNLEAVLGAIKAGHVDARVAVVVSNNPDAAGLAIARQYGAEAVGIDPKAYLDRSDYESTVVETLRSHHVEWVVLAGYMKLVGKTLLDAFPDRMINIHPSLLPAFKGLDAQKQALDAGVKEAGCSVHIVTRKMDDGPILGQVAVPVLTGDTVETLSQRILVEEHRLLPRVIGEISAGGALGGVGLKK
jgi:phosphoribosylglycinamide formyltransferase 1